MIKNALIQECMGILKREDVKSEFKTFLKPVIDTIIEQIYTYLFLCMTFVLISFLLHLGIFILLMRNKIFISKESV